MILPKKQRKQHADLTRQSFQISQLLLTWISILFAPQLIMFSELMKARLRSQGRYTIGTIQTVSMKAGNWLPKFSYVVNGKTYSSCEATLIQGIHMLSDKDAGKKFMVMFNARHPVESCLLPLNFVSAYKGEVPSSGWLSIPEGIDNGQYAMSPDSYREQWAIY